MRIPYTGSNLACCCRVDFHLSFSASSAAFWRWLIKGKEANPSMEWYWYIDQTFVRTTKWGRNNFFFMVFSVTWPRSKEGRNGAHTEVIYTCRSDKGIYSSYTDQYSFINIDNNVPINITCKTISSCWTLHTESEIVLWKMYSQLFRFKENFLPFSVKIEIPSTCSL